MDFPSIESDVELSSTAMSSSAPSRKLYKILKMSQALLREKKLHTPQSIDHVEVCPASRLAKGRSTDQSRPATQADRDQCCTSFDELPASFLDMLDYGVASMFGSKPVKSGS